VCLDSSPRYFESPADFIVLAALKQELGDLLLPRSQRKKCFLHESPPKAECHAKQDSTAQQPLKDTRRPAERRVKLLSGSLYFVCILGAMFVRFSQGITDETVNEFFIPVTARSPLGRQV
jgi:hypothetical protein